MTNEIWELLQMQETGTYVQRLSHTTESLYPRSESRSRMTKTKRKEGKRRTSFLRFTSEKIQCLLDGGQTEDP
jgi:hypothetical protein